MFAQMAIAAALDLRCYCHVAVRNDDKVSLVLPDLGIDKVWDLSALPLSGIQEDAIPSAEVEADTLPNATASPDPSLLARLRNSNAFAGTEITTTNKAAHSAALAFLYLYIRLAKSSRGSAGTKVGLARTFTIRSALPIGAGLGSSAAFSVCLASALLYLNGHRPLPSSSSSSSSSAGDAITAETTHLVNLWAFVGEKILHGNPSGVDNSVSTLGGALVFQKSKFEGEPPSMRILQECVGAGMPERLM